MLGELADARKEFLRRLGNRARVFRLRMLLPAHADRTEQGDERSGRGQHDLLVGGPDDEFAIALQSRAEEGFRRKEKHDVIQRVGELSRIIPLRQRPDGDLEFGNVSCQGLSAAAGVGRFHCVEEIQVGDFGVHDDDPVARQTNHQVVHVRLLSLRRRRVGRYHLEAGSFR